MQLLHHEGGVGAEHHHLAMRHVDDAHHAEGDGEADRREQQHRAEREPVPGVLHRAPEREAVLDRRRSRRARRVLHRRRRVGRQAGEQRRAHPGRRASRITRDGVELVGFGGVGLEQDDGGARLGQRALDARSVSFASAASSAGSALASRDLNTACAASKRLRRIGRQQGQAAERGIDARGAAGC